MGPRTLGTQYDLDEDGEFVPLQREDSFFEFEGIESPIKAARVELFRRSHAQRILNALGDHNTHPASQIPDDDTDSEPDDSDPLPCPCFDEIRQYLILNRRQLALHTMCFHMPEHTLVC